MAHKHKQLMEILARQILDGVENPGKLWQFKTKQGFQWNNCSRLFPDFDEYNEYRLKPKTIYINGIDVPEPERVAPLIGTVYFSPSLFDEDITVTLSWRNDQRDKEYLNRGLVHLYKESAAIHAKALISFTRNTTADAE